MSGAVPPGTVLGGRWEIRHQLGQGGFGQVYAVVDRSPVDLGAAAAKVLHPGTTPQERADFLLEARKMAGLRHQNLVGYLDSGHQEITGDDGYADVHPYLITELCDRSLDDELAAHPDRLLDDDEARAVVADLAHGLAFLHEQGLVHRDIKPGNALYDNRRWKLADFGLMRELTATGSYHRAGALMGTPQYMAPELFRSASATNASDVYALGVLFHVILTRQLLHPGSGAALIHNIATAPPRVSPAVSPGLARIIAACVTVEPGERATAAQVAAWLTGGAPPADPMVVAAPPSDRRPGAGPDDPAPGATWPPPSDP
ncbi:MAG: serine/threonine-protein kinase, partial [Acidimicrobiales bacterium]